MKLEGSRNLKPASEPVAVSTTPRKIEETYTEKISSISTEMVFSQQNEELASLNSANVTKETEFKNSSLFSPLKSEYSDTMFSSPSLVASPVLNYKVAQYQVEQQQHQQPQQQQQPQQSQQLQQLQQSELSSEQQLKDNELENIDIPKLSYTNSEQPLEEENVGYI